MLKLQKKQVKFVSLAIAVMFLLGIVGLAVSQSSTSYAAEANNSSKIGVVNHQLLISQHPDMANAQKTMQAEVEQAKKDFEEKSATMNDKEKQDYYAQVQQRLTLKEQELINPVFEKVKTFQQEFTEKMSLREKEVNTRLAAKENSIHQTLSDEFKVYTDEIDKEYQP
ncbi:MAG: outer rane chaperone Skp (OmpH), partial [Firmicutes bacterium]|nr:outer rane chaperone Skp (OmpH) [Bacillota bacterium]